MKHSVIAALGLAMLVSASLCTPARATISAGATGTVTINCPNSEVGAPADIWGFYTGPTGWKNTTFGTGTVDATGHATISYTIPSDYLNSFYWVGEASYNATRDEYAQHNDLAGGWGQFYTSDPNGTTVNMSVYMFDQASVTTSSASFRASAKGGTVVPDAGLAAGTVTVYQPWTGTMAQYTNVSGHETNSYYTNGKWGLSPTAAAAKGFSIDVLQHTNSDPAAVQQFEQIRLHNADNSYSVDLMCYKNTSSTDPMGYIYWTTLSSAASAACAYDGSSGVFTGTFSTPLDSSTMYFVSSEVTELDSIGATTYSDIYGSSGTDLLLSGTTVPEPATLSLLVIGGLAALRRKNSK